MGAVDDSIGQEQITAVLRECKGETFFSGIELFVDFFALL